MNQSEEDALYDDYIANLDSRMSRASAFLLAIRAAVAQERERCAKVCERYAGEHFEERADECAAAIRRGP